MRVAKVLQKERIDDIDTWLGQNMSEFDQDHDENRKKKGISLPAKALQTKIPEP